MRRATLVVLAALSSVSAPARACSCSPPGSPAQELAASTHVFVGKVTSVQHVAPRAAMRLDWLQAVIADIRALLTGRERSRERVESRPYVLVTFAVQEQFKGPRASRLAVREAASSAECGYAFERGGRYVVYARSYQAHLVSGICSLTGRVNDPRAGLAQLRAGR